MIETLKHLDAFEALIIVLGVFVLLFGFLLLAAWKCPTEGADED